MSDQSMPCPKCGTAFDRVVGTNEATGEGKLICKGCGRAYFTPPLTSQKEGEAMTIDDAVEILNRNRFRNGGWRVPSYPGMPEDERARVQPRRGKHEYKFLARDKAFALARLYLLAEQLLMPDEEASDGVPPKPLDVLRNFIQLGKGLKFIQEDLEMFVRIYEVLLKNAKEVVGGADPPQL